MHKNIIGIVVGLFFLSIPKVVAQSDINDWEIDFVNSSKNFNIIESDINWQSETEYINFPEPSTENISLFELDFNSQNNIKQLTNYDVSKWRITLWGGLMTNNDLGQSVTGRQIDFQDSQLLGVGINRKITETGKIKLEGEFQLFNHTGKQGHVEMTAGLSLRWMIFSRFNLAIIEGLSFATDIPKIEDERNTPETQLLNYLALEAEYSYNPDWSFSARLHHRSGVGGLFGGVYGGSNAYLFGIRHRF